MQCEFVTVKSYNWLYIVIVLVHATVVSFVDDVFQ